MTTDYVEPLRRGDPHLLQRRQHPLRRLHFYHQRFSGLQQALQAGEDRGPALTAAREDVAVDRTVVRLGQREPDRIAGTLDLIGHERDAELLHQPRPVDVPGDGELLRRIAFDHFATDVNRTVRRAGDERAADFQLGLHRKAGKILPGELRARQRLPDFLRRRADIDGVDDRRLEVVDVHDTPSMPRQEGGIANAVPDSSMLLRLDRMAGHPLEIPSRITLPSSKSSCVSVSFVNLPYGSSTKVTREGRSFFAASFRMWWKVQDSRRGRSTSRTSPTSVVVPFMT